MQGIRASDVHMFSFFSLSTKPSLSSELTAFDTVEKCRLKSSERPDIFIGSLRHLKIEISVEFSIMGKNIHMMYIVCGENST